MPFPLIEHGGVGPTLHWAPATGFPPVSYRPILEGLADRFRCITFPPRALWSDAGPPPETPGSWDELGVDLLAALDERNEGPVVAIGHSMGGVASLLAALRAPARFRALALLDPTILPPATMAAFRAAKATGWTTRSHPLSERARDRRSEFASYEEAFAFWRDKALFRDWSDHALRLYVEGSLRPAPGGGFTLAWTGAWEAYYYESIHLDTWEDLHRLDPSLPILVIGGGASETFGPESVKRFHEIVPWAETAVMPGYGHLFPQAAPERTLRILDDWLRRVVP